MNNDFEQAVEKLVEREAWGKPYPEDDAEELGYLMAKGEAGTGWMKFSGSVVDEYRDVMDDTTPEEFASSWLETDQWEYEVGKEFEDGYGDYSYDKAVSEWLIGYANYIEEVMSSNVS